MGRRMNAAIRIKRGALPMTARRLTLTALATLCSLVGAFAMTAVSAFAFKEYAPDGVSFGEPGSEAGHFEDPEGVAVESATKLVYVADTGNERVDEFSSTGAFVRAWGWGVGGGIGFETCTTACFKGLSGSSPGEFESPAFIAVDNSTGASKGDVYVGDVGDSTITKFTGSGALVKTWGTNGQLNETNGEAFGALHGVVVDFSGNLWVFHGRQEKDVDKLSDTGAFIKAANTHRGSGSGIAVDSSEDVYAVNGEPKVSKYNVGTEKEVAEFGAGVTALAISPSTNNVLLDQGSSIALYGPFGEPYSAPIQTFPIEPEPALTESNGIAVDAATGTVYVSQRSADDLEAFDFVPFPGVEAASVTEASVTLHGGIDLEGETVSECHFEYGTEAGVFPNSAACEQATPFTGSGSMSLSTTLSGLEARTTDHFRLTVVVGGHRRSSGALSFFNSTKPLVEEESVTTVSTSGATLGARINPAGLRTGYRFEYGPSESYGASLPVPEGQVGAGLTASRVVSVQPQGLRPVTTYHYRLVAANEFGTAHGEDKTFTTPGEGATFTLPDDRAWELVSPPDKHGGYIRPLINEDDVQVSAEGSAFTFLSEQSLLAEAHGASVFDQVLARRTSSGWSDEDVATPHDAPPGQGIGDGQEYRLFSPTLSLALIQPFGSFTALSPEATERTPYIRDNASGSYRPMVTSANVPPGTKFGGDAAEAYSPPPVDVVGTTPDLSHVVLSAEHVALTATATPDSDGLYEWSGGELQLVSVVPEAEEGELVEGSLLLGDRLDARHAISDDGSRIFWQGEIAISEHEQKHLYVRDTVKDHETTLKLDTVQSGTGEGNPEPNFQIASADGSTVFFTDPQRLTEGAGEAGKDDLYECEMTETSGAPACTLTDLTPAPEVGESADLRQEPPAVLGASEDGSYIYFVAKGVLAANENEATKEKATLGAENVYMLHNTGTHRTTSFIASLSSHDEENAERSFTSRVSPSGRYLAFMSDRSLTGYDNNDANSSEPDEEVFLYDAEAAGGRGRLICASCNPTGARPIGTFEVGPGAPSLPAVTNLVDSPGTWQLTWLAANVPTEEYWANGLEARYQPRYLSNSGRLFFNSADALVPQDGNGQWDVYEYEPAGVGTCTGESETFDETADGCLNLISSGGSSQESAFLGASETGGDVFFLTAARLTPQDTDEQFDIYDAHECSLSPCVAPSTASVSATCTEGESCRPGSVAEQVGFGSPASATLSGLGNFAPLTAKKPKSLMRAEDLAKALKACRRKPKKKRPACEKQARRVYGAAHGVERPRKGGKS